MKMLEVNGVKSIPSCPIKPKKLMVDAPLVYPHLEMLMTEGEKLLHIVSRDLV